MISDIPYKEKSSDTPVSAYQPSKEICDFTYYVKKDFSRGVEILNRPYVEFNDLSVIERMNRDQRTFNAFVDESIEDPNEAWKWRGTRSKARNKAIAMHAQLTAGYIIPIFMAQNDEDEEDRVFSDVMRDITEWMVDNSNYKSSWLMTAMGMLVNPVTYLGAEYAEVYQQIKVKTEEGYTTQEILDDVLSGFQAPVYSANEILISNAHEQNIQKQKCINKRRYIDINEAKAKYSEHENWEYVKAGMKSIYSSDDGLFYDIKDDDHPHLVEETIYYNRREDCECAFIGGIYLGNVEEVEFNPIRHRSNRGAPRYNVVPYGYQRINEHFFFYKSLTNSHYWDNQLLDAQYQVGMNRAFLDTNMPIAISGSDKIDTEIVFPSSVVAFENPDTKVTPLIPQANLGNLFGAMSHVERSIDEASVSDVTGGQLPDGDQKATGIAIAERNAKTLLQGVGKTLAESTVQYGNLMADIAVQHLTVPQVIELTGSAGKIKYPSFILKDKVVDGRNVSKTIRFEESLLGREMSESEMKKKRVSLAVEAGYPDNEKAIYLINPELFSKMKYLVRVEPQRMFPRNEEFMQSMMSQLLSQLQNNPYVSLESLTRKTLYQFFREDTEELMAKESSGIPMAELMAGDPNAEGGSVAGNIAVNKGISSGLAAVGK